MYDAECILDLDTESAAVQKSQKINELSQEAVSFSLPETTMVSERGR